MDISDSPDLVKLKAIWELTEGLGSFCCHSRAGGNPGFPMLISLDSRLRGNDGVLPEKLPDS